MTDPFSQAITDAWGSQGKRDTQMMILVQPWVHPTYGQGGKFKPDVWRPPGNVLYVLGSRNPLERLADFGWVLVAKKPIGLRVNDILRIQHSPSTFSEVEVRGIVRMTTGHTVGYVPSEEMRALKVEGE